MVSTYKAADQELELINGVALPHLAVKRSCLLYGVYHITGDSQKPLDDASHFCVSRSRVFSSQILYSDILGCQRTGCVTSALVIEPFALWQNLPVAHADKLTVL